MVLAQTFLGKSQLRTKLFLVVFICAISTAQATILKQLSLPELRDRADAIVLGRIEKIEYQSVSGQAWTVLHLRVEKSLRGSSATTISLRIPGGQQSVDGRTLVTRVEGIPEFQLQERGIFFLESLPPSYPGLLGWNQGYYRIIRRNQEDYAVGSDGNGEPLPLNEFLNQIEKGFTVTR